MSGLPFSIPATLNILDVSRASSKLSGGRDPGEALGEHRLAGPGRTDHEHIVRAGRGDLETPLCVFLALHVFEIQLVRGAGAPYRVQIGFYHRQVGPAVKIFDDLGEVTYRAHGKQRTED